MKQTSRYLFFVVQLLISLGFIYFLVRKSDLNEVRAHLVAASVPLLAASLVTKFCGFSLMAARLHYLSGSAGSLSFSESFRAQAISFVGNNVLPLRLGEGLKVAYMASRGLDSFSACIGIAAVERILDAVFLVFFISVALMFFSGLIPAGGALFLFTGVACLAFIVLLLAARYPIQFSFLVGDVGKLLGQGTSRVLSKQTAKFATGLKALTSLRLLMLLVALTAGYWIFSALSVYIWILAFGIDVPWYAALVVLVFVSLATVIPAAPGFVGTYHYFAALAMGLFAVSTELATSFAIVGHAVAIIPFTIILVPIVARDIISLHQEGIPKLVQAAQLAGASMRNDETPYDHSVAEVALDRVSSTAPGVTPQS